MITIVIIIFHPTCLSGFIGVFKKITQNLEHFNLTNKMGKTISNHHLTKTKKIIITPKFHYHFQSFIAYQQTVIAGYIIYLLHFLE